MDNFVPVDTDALGSHSTTIDYKSEVQNNSLVMKTATDSWIDDRVLF